MAQGKGSTSYWRSTLRATAVLAAIWAATTIAVPLVSPRLDGSFMGFPIGYWLAAQGGLLVFLAIVVACVLWMDRIDARHQPPPDTNVDPRHGGH